MSKTVGMHNQKTICSFIETVFLYICPYTKYKIVQISSFDLKDCDGGGPRLKHPDPYGRLAMSMGVVAIVRSSDGPTSVFLADGSETQVHAIASSMHFEPLTEPVKWHVVIREKLLPDMNVTLI